MPRHFPRGNGPICSVLIPTRGRIQSLLEAISSIYDLASRKDWIEFILKLDEDDSASINTCLHLQQTLLKGQMKIIVSPRGRGYLDMHLWVDQMFKMAEGDWVFLFNDDARMRTQNWDLMLAAADLDGVWHGLSEMCLVCCKTIDRPFDNEFFMMRKGAYDVLGHVSLSPHNDNWIWQVMSMVGSAYSSPIEVQHLSEKEPSEKDDDTRKDCRMAFLTSAEEFKSAKMTRERINDGVKLMDWIENKLTER